MSEGVESSDTDGEHSTNEARRFCSLLSLLVANVPELDVWWRDSLFGDEFDSEVLTLHEACSLVSRRLFDDGDHPTDVDGVWPRLLGVVEVALELCDLLFEADRDDDGTTVDAFAGSGIVCDITRNVASLEQLLPLMGPVTLEGVRIEIANHSTSRGYEAVDVDWTHSGNVYRSLGVSASSVVPLVE